MATVGILHSGTSGKHDAQIVRLMNRIDKTANVLPPRFGNDNAQTIKNHTGDFINKDQVDVLVAAGGTSCAVEADTQASKTSVNVVFTSADDSFVPSPNTTGVYAHTSKLDAVRLGLLHELLPAAKNIGVLRGPRTVQSDLTTMAKALGLTLDDPGPIAADPMQFATAFNTWKGNGNNAVLVTANPFFNDYQQDLVDAATLPAIYQWNEFVDLGGLISYGTKLTQAYELAGVLVNKLVNGAKVAHLPVVSLTSFELVINLRTAKSLSLSVPDTLLARADRIVV